MDEKIVTINESRQPHASLFASDGQILVSDQRRGELSSFADQWRPATRDNSRSSAASDGRSSTVVLQNELEQNQVKSS